ncbi:MAG: hypothetical protein WCP22_08420, partial [Chlamydiota bacterium]
VHLRPEILFIFVPHSYPRSSAAIRVQKNTVVSLRPAVSKSACSAFICVPNTVSFSFFPLWYLRALRSSASECRFPLCLYDIVLSAFILTICVHLRPGVEMCYAGFPLSLE